MPALTGYKQTLCRVHAHQRETQSQRTMSESRHNTAMNQIQRRTFTALSGVGHSATHQNSPVQQAQLLLTMPMHICQK